MILRVGIESGVEGRTIAWALDHPGCFAYGSDSEQALTGLFFEFSEYVDWIARHESRPWLEPLEPELQIVETWEVYTIDEEYELAPQGYEVNAWFLSDWKPLIELDIERGLKLLTWSRADLLEKVTPLSAAEMSSKQPGERWSIAGILGHIGGAEWWYLDRLGLAIPRPQLPEEPFQRLEATRQMLIEQLPQLVGAHQVVGVDGEFWSPRKMLRRALWHERDHTLHIRKLTGGQSSR
jgi:hypothetical protein